MIQLSEFDDDGQLIQSKFLQSNLKKRDFDIIPYSQSYKTPTMTFGY